jgi:hypothetical protein
MSDKINQIVEELKTLTLLEASESQNATGQTIYLPKEQILTPDSLLGVFEKIALNQSLDYVKP